MNSLRPDKSRKRKKKTADIDDRAKKKPNNNTSDNDGSNDEQPDPFKIGSEAYVFEETDMIDGEEYIGDDEVMDNNINDDIINNSDNTMSSIICSKTQSGNSCKTPRSNPFKTPRGKAKNRKYRKIKLKTDLSKTCRRTCDDRIKRYFWLKCNFCGKPVEKDHLLKTCTVVSKQKELKTNIKKLKRLYQISLVLDPGE